MVIGHGHAVKRAPIDQDRDPGWRGEEVEAVRSWQAGEGSCWCWRAEQGTCVLTQRGGAGEHDEQREQHRRHADREATEACTGRERRPETADLDLVKYGRWRLLVHRASRLTPHVSRVPMSAHAHTPHSHQDTMGSSLATSQRLAQVRDGHLCARPASPSGAPRRQKSRL